MIENRAYTNQLAYDTWGATEAGLRVANRALDALQAIKPDEKKQPKEYKVWSEEMTELRLVFTELHYRRIELVQKGKA